MKRLTIKDDEHYAPRMLCSTNRYGEVDDRDSCAEYCGDVRSCENGRCAIQQCFDRLGAYEDLEEQGKLLKLPCEVGDIVYRLYTVDDVVKVYEHHITTLTSIVNIMETGEIGKTVFLTQEAAQSALRELTS